MKPKLPLLVFALVTSGFALALGALPTTPRVAEAQATSASAKPAASAIPSAAPSVSASASASAAVTPSALPPTLASRTIPADRSDPPKPDDWSKAEIVQASRRSIVGRGCTSQLLREYLKVTCSFPMAGARQFAGNAKDVTVFVTPKSGEGDNGFFSDPQGGYIIFPLRRGEGHLFQFFSIESGYEDIGIGDSVLIDASWAESDKSPTVVIH
jgi:hypothetical protein